MTLIFVQRKNTFQKSFVVTSTRNQLVATENLVDLLHGALTGGLAAGASSASFSSAVSASSSTFRPRETSLWMRSAEAGRLLDGEAGDEQGGLEEELGDGLDGTVVLAIGLDLLLELLDDRGLGRDLEGLLGGHVGGHGGVTESLGLHDTLHVGGPAELASTDGARGADELVGDDDLLDLVAEDVLEGLGETLELLLLRLTLLLLLVGLLELEVLGDVDELLAIELLELSHGVLIDGVNQEEDLEVLLLEASRKGDFCDSLEDSPVM